MNDERAQGQLDQAKGEIKEGVGKMTGDRSTEVSGKLDQAKGQVEETIGDARESVRDNDHDR